jgi:hypothetical protein
MKYCSYTQHIEAEISKVQSMTKTFLESGYCLPQAKMEELMEDIQKLAWLCYSFGLGDFNASNKHTFEFVESHDKMRLKLAKIAAIMEE